MIYLTLADGRQFGVLPSEIEKMEEVNAAEAAEINAANKRSNEALGVFGMIYDEERAYPGGACIVTSAERHYVREAFAEVRAMIEKIEAEPYDLPEFLKNRASKVDELLEAWKRAGDKVSTTGYQIGLAADFWKTAGEKADKILGHLSDRDVFGESVMRILRKVEAKSRPGE